MSLLRKCALTGGLVIACWGPVSSAHAITILQVRAEPTIVQNSTPHIAVTFVLDDSARLSLDIYDVWDRLVRRVHSPNHLAAGERSIQWDLRDGKGRRVSDGAYFYVLNAQATSGASVRYDLTNVAAGEPVPADDVRWDSAAGKVRYILRRPAWVKIRLGLRDGGPLLQTLVNMGVRAGGEQQEAWDGYDASDVMELGRRTDLAIGVTAYSLPANALLVGRPNDLGRSGSEVDADSRPDEGPRKRRAPIPDLPDYAAQIAIVGAAQTGEDRRSSVVAGQPVSIRIDAPAFARRLASSQRLEPVLFIDGHFVFENEVGYLPMSWQWTPSNRDLGERVITINLRGYEGAFGIASTRVTVTAREN